MQFDIYLYKVVFQFLDEYDFHKTAVALNLKCLFKYCNNFWEECILQNRLDLIELTIPKCYALMGLALRCGNISMVKLLQLYNVPFSIDAGAQAIECNDENKAIEMLTYLMNNNFIEINGLLCISAARMGYLEILKWLRHTKKVPWGEGLGVCYAACERGHIHILNWAIKNGCETNDVLYQRAKMYNQLEVMKWLKEKKLF